MNGPIRYSLRSLIIAVPLIAAALALVAKHPNASAVALAVGCVWAIEALIVAKTGRRLSHAQGWALPLLTLATVFALLAILLRT